VRVNVFVRECACARASWCVLVHVRACVRVYVF